MTNFSWNAIGFCLTLAAFAGCAPSEPVAVPVPDPADSPLEKIVPIAQPEDVVIVVVDTLRPDALGFYGNENETAPYLAELVKNAAVFHRAFSSSSWTAPAVASLMTGLYPTRHGIVEGFLAFKQRSQRGISPKILPLNQLPEDITTLAQRFKAEGYDTYGIATNLNVGSEIGLDRGFDHWQLFRKDEAKKVAEQMREWEVDLANTDKPKFVYLHFMDPHMPYNQRRPWYEKGTTRNLENIARYESEISYLDDTLSRLLPRYGWDQHGTLVLASDHGEEFQDHGGVGHGFQVYNELNRVLMVVRPDGGVEGGRKVDANVSIVDLAPTVLALAGLEVPPGLDGMSVLPLVHGQPAAPMAFGNRPVFSHRIRLIPKIAHCWAVVRGQWKLIETPEGEELYDLGADFGEQNNLIAEADPNILSVLRKDLGKFREDGFRTVQKVHVDPEAGLLGDLQALGYFIDEDEE